MSTINPSSNNLLLFESLVLLANDKNLYKRCRQRAKKVVFDNPGLVDFAFGLVNSVLNLPEGQVKFFGKFKLQKKYNQCCF